MTPARLLPAASKAALLLAVAVPCCTTFMSPVPCGDERYACGHVQSVKFCENVVVAATGADCEDAGLTAGKSFCFVSKAPCVHTTYALRHGDCVVDDYTPLRQWSECSPGTPTFGL